VKKPVSSFDPLRRSPRALCFAYARAFASSRAAESDADGLNRFPALAAIQVPTRRGGRMKTVYPAAPWQLTQQEVERLEKELSTIRLARWHGSTIKNPVRYAAFLKSSDW
jgi:hypothetical protein